MLIVTAVKFIGLLVLTAMWLFFFLREKQWWILCLTCLGVVSAVVQLPLFRLKYKDSVAIAYIVIIFVVSSFLRGINYRPKRPIRFK